jgi:hypothetical protein
MFFLLVMAIAVGTDRSSMQYTRLSKPLTHSNLNVSALDPYAQHSRPLVSSPYGVVYIRRVWLVEVNSPFKVKVRERELPD